MSQHPSNDVIGLRRRPTQARAIATFNHILDTAARLLDTHGVAAFNTNLLAQAAGVSVRAVYQYFPNKQAVIAELAQQISRRCLTASSAVGSLADTGRPWRAQWSGYIRGFVDTVRATPGARPVLFAMRDVPELRAIDDAVKRRYTAGIAKALLARRPELAPKRARAAATVLTRSTVAILDEAFALPDEQAAPMIDMLVRMQVLLLESLLEPQAEVRR